MNMSAASFCSAMEQIGSSLVNQYAEIHQRLCPDRAYIHQRLYSDSFFDSDDSTLKCVGGFFFDWFFPGASFPVKKLNPNRMVHGLLQNDSASYHFFIIINNEDCSVFSTYASKLIINHVPLSAANSLLERVRLGEIFPIMPLFGFQPDYKHMSNVVVTLKESLVAHPSKHDFVVKMDQLFRKANTEEARTELTRLREIIYDI